MEIIKIPEGEKLTMKINGKLDTTTAPRFESEFSNSIQGVKELILDISALKYVSSAGLRALLYAQKTMDKQGSMAVKNANTDVMEIFEITGFVDILNVG